MKKKGEKSNSKSDSSEKAKTEETPIRVHFETLYYAANGFFEEGKNELY